MDDVAEKQSDFIQARAEGSRLSPRLPLHGFSTMNGKPRRLGTERVLWAIASIRVYANELEGLMLSNNLKGIYWTKCKKCMMACGNAVKSRSPRRCRKNTHQR